MIPKCYFWGPGPWTNTRFDLALGGDERPWERGCDWLWALGSEIKLCSEFSRHFHSALVAKANFREEGCEYFSAAFGNSFTGKEHVLYFSGKPGCHNWHFKTLSDSLTGLLRIPPACFVEFRRGMQAYTRPNFRKKCKKLIRI